MDLPKNITQIGQADSNIKIYVEDYVVSYMKQLNFLAQNKDMAVALYGVRKEEEGISYLFFYGAAKLDFLQKETRHLSQAQQQEIERLRKRYFAEHAFLGYRILDGEMVEGFHVYEQGNCRYITGYAQFYEKNDSMLAYMLDVRKEEIQPEVVNYEKYDAVKRRQEERRQAEGNETEYPYAKERYAGKDKTEYTEYASHDRAKRTDNVRQFRKPQESAILTKIQHMKVSIVATFALLCVFGFALMSKEGGVEKLKMTARQMFEGLGEQKIPDAVEANGSNVQVDTLVTEDRLTEALMQENKDVAMITDIQSGQTSSPEQSQQTQESLTSPEQSGTPGQSVTPEQSGTPGQTETPGQSGASEPNASSGQPTETPAVSGEIKSQPIPYTIKSGDTLIGISVRNYGDETMVKEICALNQIPNPDEIKIGQKILLP